MVLLLNCAIIGEGSVVSIIIDEWKTVALLKKAIADELKYTERTDKVQLFLAKKDGAWLESDSEDVKKLKKGEKTAVIEALTHEDQELQGEYGIEDVLADMQLPKTKQVHVLVVVPEGAVGSAGEASALAQLAEKVDKMYEQTVLTKRKRYVHSNVGSTQGKNLLSDLNIQVKAVRTIQVGAEPVDGFTWKSVIDEDGQKISLTEEMQRKRYREYVERNISAVLKTKQLCVIGVEKGQDILSVSVPGRDIDLSGRTDLLILSDLVEENPVDVQYLPGVRMVIEVKRDVKASSDFQALSELIALDLLVDNPVMALLTDLNGKWLFFWVSERVSEREDNSACIYKATIKKPGEAFEVIRTVLAQSTAANTEIKLPYFQDPMKRQKLSKVLPPIGECGESGGIRECIERYYDIASVLGPDIDMARAAARQITRSIPAFSYFS